MFHGPAQEALGYFESTGMVASFMYREPLLI